MKGNKHDIDYTAGFTITREMIQELCPGFEAAMKKQHIDLAITGQKFDKARAAAMILNSGCEKILEGENK